MIHRQNWLDTRGFLRFCARDLQLTDSSIASAEGHLRHLLQWADDVPLPNARAVDPTLPAYLVGQGLAPATLAKALGAARKFFEFARLDYAPRYRLITPSWIRLLRPPRRHSLESRLPARAYYTLDEVRALLSVAAETLRVQRTQAAIALLYLSGMRDGAFVTLPIACLDLPNRAVLQLPERGVHTKNAKAAVTYLLDIPDLYDTVLRWDRLMRGSFPQDAMWYPALTRTGEALVAPAASTRNRASSLRDDLVLLCEAAQVTYKSPHSLRHGHIVYARERAQNMGEYKAISQNVMHSSLQTTDSLYASLKNDSIKNVIAGLK